MSGMRELTRRIDDTAEQVARLVGRMEELERRVGEARERADDAERQLAKEKARGEGFFASAWEAVTESFEWFWLIFVIPPIIGAVVALGTCVADECGAPEPYRFTAVATAIAGPDRALIGLRCDVSVDAEPRGSCRARIRCGDTTVADESAICDMEEQVEYDSDGASSTHYRLRAMSAALVLREVNGIAVVERDGAETRIVLHEWASEGAL
jgi:hypothetical protein